MALPLFGLKVLDFSTLLPGPMASLMLAEAGADVIKVERPGGEDLRRYAPESGEPSGSFRLLNRGKQSLSLDLKDPEDRRILQSYLDTADVLIEQFRPGVMERLGLGYGDLRKVNPGLVYCSITGYGQDGPRRDEAGHDLNYMAETGLLGLSGGADGAPVLPPVLAGDIGGGTYPAMINILLALRQRDTSGEGAYLDIAMADNLFPFVYWALGVGFTAGAWPRRGGELVTGGSARYRIYRTSDNRFLAAAPIEEKFWKTFCDAIGLPERQRDDQQNTAAVIEAVTGIIATRTASQWQQCFAGLDVCVSVVATLEEAVADPAFAARKLFSRRVSDGENSLPALPVAIVPGLRRPDHNLGYAVLGGANANTPKWSGNRHE